MRQRTLYDRYVLTVALILVAVGGPMIELVHEHHHAEPPALMQPIHKNEHTPDAPAPLPLASTPQALVGTAAVATTWSHGFD